MFAMMLKFGLPTLMFTVTPEDSFNLRITILFKDAGLHKLKVPKTNDPVSVLNEFVINLSVNQQDSNIQDSVHSTILISLYQ